MITAIEIPKLTLTMEGGTLVRWLKREGETVQKDEVLFELETDKANTEVPAPAAGLLRRILVKQGPVAIGTTVGFIGEKEDALPVQVASGGERVQVGQSEPTPSVAAQHQSESTAIRATPAARRRAREARLNLESITGTGPEGRITQEDVEAAIAKQGRESKPGHSSSDFRGVIAERTSQAWRTVPHIHVGGELNGAGLTTALEDARARGASGINITDLLLFATASVLRSFPSLNAVWRNGHCEPQASINLAFAVHTDRGVVAPVIHAAERRDVIQISSERLRLKNAASDSSLKPADLEAGTFTVSNLGMFPVDFFAPIVNFPQCAILATGRLKRVAVTEQEPSAPRWKIWANLALDHRVADGAVAAHFLAELEKAIEDLRSLAFRPTVHRL